jgi:hypothetical protein
MEHILCIFGHLWKRIGTYDSGDLAGKSLYACSRCHATKVE